MGPPLGVTSFRVHQMRMGLPTISIRDGYSTENHKTDNRSEADRKRTANRSR
jgi:hypothetical protein